MSLLARRTAALSAAFFVTGALFAGEVINQTFDIPPDPADLAINGTASVADDGCGNQVLSLTQAAGNQLGYAWFTRQFDLNQKRVEIEFDLFIGQGSSTPPADGLSVIFQFDNDMSAIGGAGGGLGTTNFRGNASPYISVAFDIWDNDANLTDPNGVDPETICDGVYGPQSTCHVEVNQNIDPGVGRSGATAEGVDFIARAAQYAPKPPGSCDPSQLIHVEVIFDSRLMVVKLDGDSLIEYATAPFPDQLSNVGFAASTGGANAIQWVDNVVVREEDPKVTIKAEDPLSSAALNAGGDAVNATAEVGFSFQADRAFGTEISRSGDIDTGLVITTNRFGRISNGADFTNTNPRPIDVSKVPGAGPETAKVFADDAWSTFGVDYRAEVAPGRYEVKLYWAENFPGAVNGSGEGVKLYDVYLSGSKVLCNWSAAAAAGSATGSGSPWVPCSAVLDRAVVRTFSVDVPDGGAGFGVLDVLVDDLGEGTPPENAALDALSFKRLGGVTGTAAAGDIECVGRPSSPPPPAVAISEDFDGVPDGDCPPGMICNQATPDFAAQAAAGRLQVITNGVNNSGTTALFDTCVNVADAALEAEFDVYMFWDTTIGELPADGGAFFVMEGTDTTATGFAGGALGIPLNAYGFAVEFDSYWNGGWAHEPSGLNNPAEPYVHVGINNMSYFSYITSVEYDPGLKPTALGGTGWPNFLDPAGVHVKVTYNSGHVEVTLSGNQDDGTAFGPKLVAVADVTPINGPKAQVGFSGGTGGLNQTLEFDNVQVSAAACREPTPAEDPVAVALLEARKRWDEKGELYINAGGPTLICGAHQNPAPAATGDAGAGEEVVWVGDGASGVDSVDGGIFRVSPVGKGVLYAADTDMGYWDARGTSAGVDDDDLVLHTVRYSAIPPTLPQVGNGFQYEIPAPDGTYELTLYFANQFSGTAGTGRRVFHVDVMGERKTGFDHCQYRTPPPAKLKNPFFGFDAIFDPVDAGDHLYGDPCNFTRCPLNGVTADTDPDIDRVLAFEECGNAAAVALRYEVEVKGAPIKVALTPPSTTDKEPASPDTNPTICGITVKKKGGQPVASFRRGDADASGKLDLTDAIFVLGFLFQGGAVPPCLDAADADDSGALDLTDAIFILGFLFQGGAAPPAPGPSACGPDTTPSAKLTTPCVYTCQ